MQQQLKVYRYREFEALRKADDLRLEYKLAK